MVKNGILDLWQEFQNSLGPDGDIVRKGMMEHIRQYVFGIRSIQSFRFYEKFLPEYGFEGFWRYLGDSYHGRNFSDGLLEIVRSNSNTRVKFTLNCDYLESDKDRYRLLLHWLDEYVFCSWKIIVYKTRTGEFAIASQTVCEHLPEVLEKNNYSLNTQEIAHFLNICTRLVKHRKLSFYEVRDYMAKIKEVPADVS